MILVCGEPRYIHLFLYTWKNISVSTYEKKLYAARLYLTLTYADYKYI